MRRPNRSIEVFDISLMAVVTKAMGAFLVLMLLLMPYYSSGPIGSESAADLEKRLEDAQKKLQSLSAQAGQLGEDPERLRKLLEEARKELEEAQRSLARLKRDNDALNAQVKRLEEQADKLKKDLDEQTRPIATGHIINWDCNDVRLELGMIEKGYQLSKEVGDPQRVSYLNFSWSIAEQRTITADEAVKDYADKATPGHGLNFNQSGFYLRPTPGTWVVAVVSTSKATRKYSDKFLFRPLKRPATDCKVLFDFQMLSPTNADQRIFFPTQELVLSKENAAKVYLVITVSDAGEIRSQDATPENSSWFTDQLKLAEIAPSDSPPPDLRQQILERLKDMQRKGEIPTTDDEQSSPPAEQLTPEEQEKRRKEAIERVQRMDQLRKQGAGK